MNKRNFSTYETTERNVRRLRHHSGLSLFHAQPTLTTRLRCDRRHAVKRELSSESSLRSVSLSTSLIVGVATAIIAVGDQTQEGHLVKDHCATQHEKSVVSLTGVGIVHGSGRRGARGLMLRRLRRYPEGGEERSGHCARGDARRWRRALLAYEQTRGREPEELGSLEPRPIVARQVRSLRGYLHRHRDSRRYHS